MRSLTPLVLLALLALNACDDGGSGDPPPPDMAGEVPGDMAAEADRAVAPDQGDAAAPDMRVIDASPPPARTRGVFDPSAALDEASFFDQPWPADWRTLPDGRLDVSGYPIPGSSPLLEGLQANAAEQRGAIAQPVIWFRFDGPVEAPAEPWIVDLSSGERVPSRARLLSPDGYVPETLIAIAPRPGVILRPATRYAAFMLRGADLDPAATLSAALAGEGDFADAYAPLVARLPDLGLTPDAIAAATVFTTGDPVADLHALSEAVRTAHDATFEPWVVDPDDGADHPRFCELHGRMTVPNFLTGEPPYNTAGIFEIVDGAPVPQGESVVPVVLTLPRQAMPEGGYPLVVYLHGSGGLSTQGVDRGRVPAPGRPETKGEGPAHVLAAEGFATVTAALPLNPQRGGPNDYAYLNFQNLRMFRDVFRQGILEQRLMLDALADLVIDPATVAACAGLDHLEGAPGYQVRVDPVFAMGQSMGGQYTNLFGAVEPRITAVVPTGAGGYWSWFILFTDLLPAEPLLRSLLGASGALSEMHPGMHLMALAWEPAEPFVYMPRLARWPLPGHPRRDIYTPVGQGDVYFPTPVFDAAALAYGTEQAGAEVWDTMQPTLALDGREGLLEYPITANRGDYTAVVVQYPADGILNGHYIFQQLDAVKRQYATFLRIALDTGRGTVVAPE